MADKRGVYVDACSFVDLVKTNIGQTLTSDKENDVWFLKRLLEAHRDGEVLVYTSTLSIAECRHVGERDLSEKAKSEFNRLLLSGQYVRLVQITPFIAQDARDLQWVQNITGVRGADSIHIASALAMKCEEFLSSNGKLERAMKHADALARFGLYVKPSRNTACLPAKYRQMEMKDDQGRH